MRARKPDKGRISSDSPFVDVIERAYIVFRRPKPDDTSACDCCWDNGIKADFFNHDPRDLPFFYLSEWFCAAVDLTLPQDLWAWLLPRLLEVLASGEEMSWAGIEVALYRYPTGDREVWSKEEWEVLDDFQRIYIDQIPVGGGHNHLDDIICMFASAGWPMETLFEQVLAWPTERIIGTLRQEWKTYYGLSIWVTAFWKDVSKAFWTYGLNESNPTTKRDHALELADFIAMNAINWSEA